MGLRGSVCLDSGRVLGVRKGGLEGRSFVFHGVL